MIYSVYEYGNYLVGLVVNLTALLFMCVCDMYFFFPQVVISVMSIHINLFISQSYATHTY